MAPRSTNEPKTKNREYILKGLKELKVFFQERKNWLTLRWKYVDVNAEKFHFGGARVPPLYTDLQETTHQYEIQTLDNES